MAGGFLIFFTLFWTAGVFFFDGVLGYKAYKQFESGSFPSVTGTVTHSAVEQRTGSKGRIYYVAVVDYEYSVNGQALYGNKLRFGMGQQAEDPEGIVAAHPVNYPVRVFYNPKNPVESLLYPGITGSDILMFLFLTPFNMILIGLWGGTWIWLRERLFKPVAGGVRIIVDGMTTRVRLPTVGAITWGLATTGLLGLLSMLVLLITTRSQPSIAAVLLTTAVVYLAGGGVWFWQQQKINSGIDDLVINEGSRTIDLPLTCGRKERVTVQFTEVENIWVDVVEHHNSKGGTSYSYAPTLNIRHQLDRQKLVDWPDKLRANDFTDWLGKKIGVSTQRAPDRF
ncbi:MAG TPA: DUF3592 domain-containing protein [Pseudomonadales bacterium]|nr:DUF3592 domain-containing protein [Pseudomonadales bacterium]